MAGRRHKMSRKGSRKHFSRNAKTHKKNVPKRLPMRGGIRL